MTHQSSIPMVKSNMILTLVIAFMGGKFKGAQGQITGNSQGTADGRFTDHQVYKIVLPGRS
jgi:hypothetical protein